MAHTVLIPTDVLAAHLDDPRWAVIDARFSLADPEQGRRHYEQAHIPGALYAHLDEDLSGPIIPGQTGRHPLPPIDQFTRTLSAWGIDPETQVVVYDDAGGTLASRLWWMLGWLGHDQVAVLDGGWPKWRQEGRSARSGWEERPSATFVAKPRPERLVSAAEVEAMRVDPAQVLVDSRGAARYRGDEEPLDAVGGHIPGAVNLPFGGNLNADGTLQEPPVLRARFEQILQNREPSQAVFYCGSGVTAAHNLLALAHAGLPPARLYAGSWSEWITDPARPVATG